MAKQTLLKNLHSMLIKEQYKMALKKNLRTTKDENGFVRIDYRLLTNI